MARKGKCDVDEVKKVMINERITYRLYLNLLVFLCSIWKLHAQPNLVPNHSFENKILCPSESSVNGGHGIQTFVYNWTNCYQPSQNNFDAVGNQYFHTCSPRSFGIPNNYAGYQYSIDGNAYAGTITIYDDSIGDGQRVFLGAQLLTSLKKNKLYRISFMASPKDSLWDYFSHLGLRLFVGKPEYIGKESLRNLPNYAHIVDTNVLDCDKCWYKISGEVVADSAYDWLAIGNFYRLGSFKRLKIPNGIFPQAHLPNARRGGYYIDDVWVQEVQQLFANSKRICKGDSAALWTYKLPTGSLWDDGMQQYSVADTQWVKPQTTTTYTIYTPDGEAFDSVTIEVYEPPTQKILPTDTMLCRQPYITLNAFSSGSEYLWSTQSTSPSIDVIERGLYKVQLGLPNCRVFDSTFVEVCEPTLFVPNAFTPNGDGINDEFKPVGVRVHSYNMIIYDRWGGKVFETNDLNSGWNGEGLPSDVYFYIIWYEDDFGYQQQKGNITLIK